MDGPAARGCGASHRFAAYAGRCRCFIEPKIPGDDRFDLLCAHAAGDRRIELWGSCFARVLKLREGGQAAALIAARADITIAPPFGAAPPDADLSMPLLGYEPAQDLWNTPELLGIDAELLLRQDAPGAAEAKLLRALEIARRQSALSWELRAAMRLARLWQSRGQAAQVDELLIATCGKFIGASAPVT